MTVTGSASVLYDAENRMTNFNSSAETNGYFADGMRAWNNTSAGKTFFLYDDGVPVCELNSSGTVTATNTFGPNGLISRTAGGSTNWYTFDPQGNTSIIYQGFNNSSSQNITDAYGAMVSGTFTTPYDGFGGQYGNYHDPTTGWFLMGHRFYAAGQARFVNRDPIGYDGGINLYGYGDNDPMNLIDPSGYKVTLGSVGGFIDKWGTGGAIGEFGAAYHDFQMGPQCWEAAGTLALQAEDDLETSVELTFLPGPKGLKGPCFVADTPVQMADGTTKPIEQVKAGDKVESRNPQTGKTEAKTVTRTFVKHSDQLVTVRLSDGEKITCTPEHPFHVQGAGFVEAGELTAGTAISTGWGSALIVSGIEWQKEQVGGYTVYNFEVAGDHTYFVGNQNGGVWVHNDCTNVAARALKGLLSAGKDGEVWNVNRFGRVFGAKGWRFHDVIRTPEGVIDQWATGLNSPVPVEAWKPLFMKMVDGAGLNFDDWYNMELGSGAPTKWARLMKGW